MNLELPRSLSWLNAPIASLMLFSPMAHAQVQTNEVKVIDPPGEYQIDGKIYPQFWQASLTDQVAFVPLARIISFGIQDYEVVGGGHVYELTVAMESQVMMRIYVIEPPSIVNRAKEKAAPATDAAEGIGAQVPPVTSLQTDSVVKHYPATTHLPTMEFRVKERETVDKLFIELRTAYLNFRLREVVAPQREEAVITSKVAE